MWALRINDFYAVVELVDCSLSKASQLRRYQNLITHESQHPCAQETPTNSMVSAIPTHVVGEVKFLFSEACWFETAKVVDISVGHLVT